jgi:cystathionine beta-synthase
MKTRGISQLPVLEEGKLVGVVSEKAILASLAEDGGKLDAPVGALTDTAFAVVDRTTPMATVSKLFNQGNVVIVMDNEAIVDIITKIDVIEYMASRLT